MNTVTKFEQLRAAIDSSDFPLLENLYNTTSYSHEMREDALFYCVINSYVIQTSFFLENFIYSQPHLFKCARIALRMHRDLFPLIKPHLNHLDAEGETLFLIATVTDNVDALKDLFSFVPRQIQLEALELAAIAQARSTVLYMLRAAVIPTPAILDRIWDLYLKDKVAYGDIYSLLQAALDDDDTLEIVVDEQERIREYIRDEEEAEAEAIKEKKYEDWFYHSLGGSA